MIIEEKSVKEGLVRLRPARVKWAGRLRLEDLPPEMD